MAKRASYREGIDWIALNDEPGTDDPAVVADQISVLLLADLFEKEPEEVAHAVIRHRKKGNR